MRINYNKLLLTLLLFTVSFATFAQLPDPDGPGPGDDDPPAPINGKLIYLAIAAVAFGILFLRSRRTVKA